MTETTNGSLNRKLNMALVGGGQGAFIGRVRATAAVLDNRAALVAGALSSDAERARASAPAYDIPADRAYGSHQELIDEESKKPDGERVDFISVATPNHTHFEIAKAAVDAGFNLSHRCQHENRHRNRGAQIVDEIETALARHHPIQDDEIEL